MGILLGDEVKCCVTGFVGVVNGITNYRHGCRRIAVRPCEFKDGRPQDDVWIDEPDLEVIKRQLSCTMGFTPTYPTGSIYSGPSPHKDEVE